LKSTFFGKWPHKPLDYRVPIGICEGKTYRKNWGAMAQTIKVKPGNFELAACATM
jgi:hypothetical protein